MERAISVEEKIRRAEEIYNRRRENEFKSTTARVNVENKKNRTILKKMRNQIIGCLVVYLAFYYLSSSNFIFSEEFKNKANEVLSYEISFNELYNKICNYFNNIMQEDTQPPELNQEEQQEVESGNVVEENKETEEKRETTNNEENSENSENNEISENIENLVATNIGGATQENTDTNTDEVEELTEEAQMKKDAEEIKNTISFIVPVQGTITSVFGPRNPTVSTVSKYHTGLDIGAVVGTDILSATDGKVTLRSTTGDYGYHLKIETGDVVIIYAHCSKLLVNEGDAVKQGQKIAEVGSTGNSTGPHLHFEIRKSGRYVNPQLILNI